MLRPDMRTLLFNSYGEIPAADWNRLAGRGTQAQPFLQHSFLAGLESSHCAIPDTGWAPQLLTVWEDQQLRAATPMYAKTHSMGEFVFDWSWADAYARHQLAYYPKLTVAVPFSPIQGPRLLAADASSRAALLEATLEHAQENGFSSLHILFPEPTELPLLEDRGLLIRHGVQFHWQNPGYRDFEDFLSSLTREKRKKIRQEQRRVRDAGIRFTQLSGDQLRPEHIAFAHACYANTYHVRGRHPYLTLAFFQHLTATMPDNLLLVIAMRDDEPVAMALNLYNDDTLWGRYWGCLENIPCLHFDTCYYQAIDFCIARGIKLFEGGAQGEHKLARGFMPVTTYSAHWVAHPEFRAAIAHFLERETQGIAEYMDELEEHAPFLVKAE
jgi:predicted N-acyltransferase